MALSESQSAALSAICVDPLFLSTAWEGAGHRRQLFFFTNLAADVRVSVGDIFSLASLGLVELADDPKDPEALWAKYTARGFDLAQRLAAPVAVTINVKVVS